MTSTANYPPLHLLLIDNDDKSGNRLHRKLNRIQWTTEWVKSLMHTKSKLSSDCYDVALINNDIPGGIDVLNQIRQQDKNIPVMVLSSAQSSRERTEYINCGADDCLTKPYSHDELLARVNALYRRKALAADGPNATWKAARY